MNLNVGSSCTNAAEATIIRDNAVEQHCSAQFRTALEVIKAASANRLEACYVQGDACVINRLKAAKFSAEPCNVTAHITYTNAYDPFGETMHAVEDAQAIYVPLKNVQQQRGFFASLFTRHITIFSKIEITESDTDFDMFAALNRKN